MISNQILQDTIDGLKNITRTDLCVLDTEGKILASTFKDVDDCEEAVLAFVDSRQRVRQFVITSSSRYLTITS